MNPHKSQIKGKKVLITGGLGFLGSTLAIKCVELGAQVTVYDNLDPHSGGNIQNVNEIKSSISILNYDILSFDLLSQEISKAEIIINCAASTSHPFSMKEPWIDLDVNSKGVLNILEAIKRFNVGSKFIHIGTSTQLGKLHYQPADEYHPEFPLDIYSANKMVSEKYVRIYSQAYNLNATVLRLSNTYGPRASIHSPEFTFNNYFIGLALQNKPITVFRPGNQLRNLIYVDDAVDAIILSALASETSNETFFVTGDEHYSVAQIAEATVSAMGGEVDYVKWPSERKAIDFGDAVITNEKIKNTIAWKPQTNLEEGLEKTRNYYKSCLDKYLR